ncbi:MAG TPA: GAF domain-containing protein, partial [Polyangiaceae bacterium]|nr:GAF domain-containing protein [Polyangiaceae bacterium]
NPPAGVTVPLDVIPPAPAVPTGLSIPTSQNLTQPSPALDMPPPSSVLRQRQEEPTPESPIIYREVAYVVDPGVSRGSVEALLWASFNSLSRELASKPGQKFVQLAVFDHKFDKRPERAPLGTLAWKDWRGNPVVTFPFFDGTAVARASAPPPGGSIKPVAVVKLEGPSGRPPPPADPAPTPAHAVAYAAAPIASATTTPIMPLVIQTTGSGSIPAPAPAVIALAQPAQFVAASAPAVDSSSTAAAKSDPSGAAIPLTREKLPSHPSAGRSSKPRLPAVRRRAGEDLIGELFETMHDLSFMHGVADGAEFVLAAVESIVPCEGVLIHVFDINARQFVVVRAKGPGTMQAVLHRTPDSDEFFANIMRRPGSVAIHDTAKDARVLGPRWEALGVKPLRALCGPVRQGGRYLGIIELANPLGDAPFHQTEQNAIDYVCEQFAQFLLNRPIVLDADVVLRR